MILPTFITLLVLFISLSSANNMVHDYCVGDLSLPSGPTAYSCKDPTKLSVDDFVYSGLRESGNTITSKIFKISTSDAYTAQFPALNGMGLSIVRVDLDVGGFFPVHAHRVSELLVLIEGTIIAGFIDTNNTAFYKTLHKGDIMIFPPMLLHFIVNVESTPVLAYASFSSENPGAQFVDTALFRNNLPSDLVEKITLFDDAQVKKLKGVFGGTN